MPAMQGSLRSELVDERRTASTVADCQSETRDGFVKIDRSRLAMATRVSCVRLTGVIRIANLNLLASTVLVENRSMVTEDHCGPHGCRHFIAWQLSESLAKTLTTPTRRSGSQV